MIEPAPLRYRQNGVITVIKKSKTTDLKQLKLHPIYHISNKGWRKTVSTDVRAQFVKLESKFLL